MLHLNHSFLLHEECLGTLRFCLEVKLYMFFYTMHCLYSLSDHMQDL